MMTNDFEFIDSVVSRVDEKKAADGGGSLRAEERYASVVWAASGIIGNGGFLYFFENELSCEDAIEGYDSIGMPKIADIFRTALSLFPDGKPTIDWSEALAIIRSREDLFAKLSAEVWNADAEIISRLASYLRAAGIQ